MPTIWFPKRAMIACIALVGSASVTACLGNGTDLTDPSLVSNIDPNTTRTKTSIAGDPNSIVGNGNTGVGNSSSTNGNSTNGNATTQAGPALIQVPLKGCFASDYTAPIRLGDGSTYQLIVDTGSTTLAVAASLCTNCSGISPSYAPGAKAVDDRYTATGAYGDGSSWSGEIYSDSVDIGNGNDVTMAFATIDRQSMSRTSGRNFFNASYCSGSAVSNTTQGIIGFGASKIALPHTDAYLDKFKTNNNLADAVAFQFCDLDGNLWMGGYDPNTVSAAPVYTPMNTTNGFYEVEMTDMLMDNVPIGNSAGYGAAVVDTGTSIMIVTSTLFDALGTVLDNDAQFVSYFGPGFMAQGSCSAPASAVSRDTLDANLPKMVMTFPDAQGNTIKISMAATDSYLMAMKQPDGTVGYCAAVASGGGTGGLPNVLLGNNLMHSQITIFDRANNRLGFAPQVGCPRL